jgi:hypothetical protein
MLFPSTNTEDFLYKSIQENAPKSFKYFYLNSLASTNTRFCNFPTRRQTDQNKPYDPRVTTAAACHVTRV